MADTDLKASYETALRHFRAQEKKLQTAQAPHKPAADAAERILACAEEYGVGR